jgi:hypothetical protein
MVDMEKSGFQGKKLTSSEVLVWTTATEISVLIDGKHYYRGPIKKEELLRLAHLFLEKALERVPE